MPFQTKSEFASWTILIGLVILFIEIVFFNSGIIFSFLVTIGMIYIGRKRYGQSFGKVIFFLGIAFFIITVFNMATFKFFLLAVFIHFLIQYAQTKKNPIRIEPIIKEPIYTDQPAGRLIRKKTLFDNVLFGERKTPEMVYEWNDINIQAFISDTVIDLSYTVLPKSETVIFVRNLIGNVEIRIPYDMEVCINHSVILGNTEIFGEIEERTFNQSILMQTEEYEQVEQKIKIVTSLGIGNLEVKRV